MARAVPIITTPTSIVLTWLLLSFQRANSGGTLLTGSSTTSAISNQYQIHHRPTVKDEMARSTR